MTLASIGRFHFFEQARALAQTGGLDRFYCDDPRVITAAGWGPGRWLTGAGLRARMASTGAAQMLPWLGEQLAHAAGAATLVKINSAFALETIQRGTAGRVWVDHGSLNERFVAARMQEEAERWGDPLVAAGGNHDSAVLVERQAEEFARAAGVVVASELAARSMIEQGVAPGKLKVVALGVDARRFAPRRAPAATGRFRILHAGPVTFNKGVHRLIQAFRVAALPGATLCIAGRISSAAVRERLVRQAAGLAVEFRPPVAQAALPVLFGSSDLFVLASLADGFGLTVLQAMACELPVVVTGQCGCQEVIAGCAAVEVVPAGDTEALAAALTQAYQRRGEQRERGRAARLWAQELDWKSHAGRLQCEMGLRAGQPEWHFASRGVQW